MAIRLIDKEKIIKILMSRPAIIRSMNKPDDDFLARCMMVSNSVMDFVKKDWLTLPVLEALLQRITKEKYFGMERLSVFPVSVCNAVSPKLLAQVCNIHPEAVEYFPNAPYKLWLKRVSSPRGSYIKFQDIPEHHRTEELLAGFFVNHYRQIDLPEELFTDSLVDNILLQEPELISKIPEKFITRTRLERALAADTDLSLGKALPETVWNQELANQAMGDIENIHYLPKELLTKEICLKAVNGNEKLLDVIPIKKRDEEIYIMAMTSNESYSFQTLGDLIPQKILTKPFLLKLAAMDKERYNKPDGDKRGGIPVGIMRYNASKHLTDNDWVEVIKIHPIALRLVERTNQTTEMFKAFIETASIEMVDTLMAAGKINLSKIKVEHCPLLIATKNATLQGIIQRKMAPPVRVKKIVPNDLSEKTAAPACIQTTTTTPTDKVEVDLTDGELLEITKRFNI